MKSRCVDCSIKKLDLSKEIFDTFETNNVKTIEDLWAKKREELKQMSLSNDDIKTIVIELQLLGLDLNKKIY